MKVVVLVSGGWERSEQPDNRNDGHTKGEFDERVAFERAGRLRFRQRWRESQPVEGSDTDHHPKKSPLRKQQSSVLSFYERSEIAHQ
jgi:hypothetical protein